MKILWHSNCAHVGSGYGQQTNLFVPLFKQAGHDIAVSAVYGIQGAALEGDYGTVYPADNDWGNEWIREHAAHHAGTNNPADCLTITLMDVWTLKPKALKGMKVASWVPIDHNPIPPAVLRFFKETPTTPIAMSKFGERLLQEQNLDPLYVPHGVDTTALQPVDKTEAREKIGAPKDAFIVGMVAANKANNPCRKAFPEVLKAFAEFRRRHDDAFLYLHTNPGPGPIGISIPAVIELNKIDRDAVAFANEYTMFRGIPYQQMASVYSMMDVFVNPSYGEGFGVPIIEAQSCGVPVIVNDYTSMPELVGAGWVLDVDRFDDEFYDLTQLSNFCRPRPSQILDALEDAYANRGSVEHARKAREFAIQYDHRIVFDRYWKPALDRILAPREIAPLKKKLKKPLKVAS